MKPKHARAATLSVMVLLFAAAVALMLFSMRGSLVYFYTPSDWYAARAQNPATQRTREIRLGGLVEPGTLRNQADGSIRFRITDGARSIPVRYRGFVPSLFREGQGVVAQGRFRGNVFMAGTVLAKHDERYLPKEVVDALKRSGRWQP